MKKKDYQKYQSQYIQDYILFLNDGKLSNNIMKYIQKEIKNILSDNNHPQYNNYLKKIRHARKFKNGSIIRKNTLNRYNYTYNALIKMKEIGLSDNTLKKIITTLNHKQFNYYNTINKIKSLGKISYEIRKGKEYLVTELDIKENIINEVGGVCHNLSVGYKEFFLGNQLDLLLSSETNKEVSLKIYNGKDRTHFIGKNSNHVYCILSIGNDEFIIDPSFGEISIRQESGYMVENEILMGMNMDNISLQSEYNELSITSFFSDKKEIDETTKIGAENVDVIFLGFLNEKYGIHITYLRQQDTRIVYPLIFLRDYFIKQDIWYILGDKNELIQLTNNDVPTGINTLVRNHLLVMKEGIT